MQPEVERWSPFHAWLYSLVNRKSNSNIAVVDYIGVREGDRLLDIGCGPGAALQHASARGAIVSAVDPSPSMVERAASRVPSADVKIGNAEDLPFQDARFDVVINIASFHHWADREAGLVEVLRVLAPGGRLHVVEGLLRDGRNGHGLSRRDADVLAAKLVELGYVDPTVDDLSAGRRNHFLVVTGRADEAPPPSSDSGE